MLHVEQHHARRTRGSRRWPVKVTGHCAFYTHLFMSTSDWNKETYGDLWFKMMVWNRAALHMESGVPREWARRAYYLRWPGKWRGLKKGVHR